MGTLSMNTTRPEPKLALLREAAAFGRDLIRTEDLDPIYSALVGSGLPLPVRERWCVAYWLFYHAGVACLASEEPGMDVWSLLLRNVGSWPRGTERRHFRGEAAVDALLYLQQRGTPERIVRWLLGPPLSGVPFATVSGRAKTLPQFGPWIAWKLADMGERCLERSVSFSSDTMGLYRDPRQGAALVATGDHKAEVSDETVARVVKALELELAGCLAPPLGDRPVNVQEVETVCCKYKAQTRGHYHVGKDSKDVREALEWAVEKGSRTAPLLLDGLLRRCSLAGGE